MLARLLLVAGLVCGVAVGARAAEPVKLELKDFKIKVEPAENGGHDEGENRLYLYSNGTLTGTVKVTEDGEYTLTFEASCTEAEKELAKLKIKVGDDVAKDSFALTTTDPKEYTLTVKLKKGDNKVSFEFLNDKYKENEYDLNVFLHAVKVTKK